MFIVACTKRFSFIVIYKYITKNNVFSEQKLLKTVQKMCYEIKR